jgi:hypothetical protein
MANESLNKVQDSVRDNSQIINKTNVVALSHNGKIINTP